MSKFNLEQEKAITSRGNVIVSAGAGSGKTTVLTERVKRNILGEGCDKVNLDELLILTFTNDAAQSMKNRIKEALNNNLSLAHLVPLVDSAHIETIDAYQKFIVSKFGQQFGYPKNINVMSDDILLVKAVEILQKIFDDLYESENEIFKEIIFNYCVKNDNQLFDFILEIFKKNLAKTPQKLEYLEKYKENYLNKNYFENLILNTNSIIKKDISILKETINNFSSLKIRSYYQELVSPFTGVNTLEDLINVSEELKEDKKTSVKDYLSDIKDDFIRELEEENIDRARQIYETLRALSSFDLISFRNIDVDKQIKYLTFIIDKILVKLVNECEKFKIESAYFTFSDISNIATRILEDSEEIRNELKNQYKLIMVDECQDNSSEQNHFIDLISNDNVFCVGDVKQSIYKFRKAAPEIFQEKYNKYKSNENGIAVDMNTNYRSRDEIIDEINSMFSKLMTDEFGGANYKKDHIIKRGNKAYDEVAQKCLNHGVFSISNAVQYCDDFPKNKYNKNDKYEGEALAVAIDILSRIYNNYEVVDKDENGNNISRRVRFKDFAILTYNSKAFEIYEEVLETIGIPVKVIYSDNIKKDMTIILMANIFKLLYLLQLENPTKVEEGQIKHCLVSILRSYVSETNDEQIYNLFKNKTENYKNSLIYKKYAEFAGLWKNLPLSEVYLRVLNTENFVENVAKLKNAVVAIDKNNILYEKTKIMDDLGYSLKDLSEYFERIDSYNIEVEQEVVSQSDDAVTLTTIHKSKGLEYPCVYLPSLWNFRKPKNKNFGDYYELDKFFFLPLFADPEKKANIFGYNLKEDDEFENVYNEERLRLFYVALTRAKEDLIFVFDDEGTKTYDEVYSSFKNEVLRFIEESKISMSEEEIENEIQRRIKWRESKLIGRDFLEFLNKSYSSYKPSPYLDNNFVNFWPSFEKYLGENEIELDDLEKAFINQTFINEYLASECEISNMNLQEFFETQVKKVKKYQLSKVREEKTLYKGPHKYKEKILLDINIVPSKANKYKALKLVFEDGTYIVNRLTEEKYAQILKFIAYNQIDELIKFTEIFDEKKIDLSRFNDEEVTKKVRVEVTELNIERVVNQRSKKASKDVDDDVNIAALRYGNHLHALLEIVDFKNPNYSLLKDNVEKIKKVVSILNDSFDLQNAEIYKEYQFEDLTNGTNGVIDLLLIIDNKAYIIDYKLKNIDDEKYNYQLKVYKDYVSLTFKAESIKTYLLSILNFDLEERKV